MGKYDNVLMETAKLWAKQSTCKRKQVGCVIAKDGRIISIGYNGTITSTDNSCEYGVLPCTSCGAIIPISEYKVMSDRLRYFCECGNMTDYTNDSVHEHVKLVTSDLVMHAEQNALMFCAKEGIGTKGCTIYVTHSPCEHCSKLIASSGITRVVYEDEYKNVKGLDLLKNIGINVNKIKGDA